MKHTKIMKENSKGMEDLGASNVSHVSLKPSQWIQITTPCASTFQAMTMPMIFSLTEHSFLPVSSIEGRVVFYSKRGSCIMTEGKR